MQRHGNHEGETERPRAQTQETRPTDGKRSRGRGADREEAVGRQIIREIFTDLKKNCSLIKKAGF